MKLSGSRAPQGARGLKSIRRKDRGQRTKSRPARGAWVEIAVETNHEIKPMSRPARGAWVEIKTSGGACKSSARRAPQGARGLK